MSHYFERTDKNYRVFLEGFEYARAEPVTPGYFELLAIKETALGQLWRGEQSAQQVMTILDDNIASFLAR